MVFLKEFYAEGFKSFADKVTLNFENGMIGIIGPNGSGKSNIVDALKWTIGEQSVKALRGSEKSNLIFMGAEGRPEAEFAMVTLTFDNSTKILHHDAKTVSVTRKLIRKTGESQFFINNEPVRLKDIQDIFLDTGLSKGSLGIISQGTVNWFAEAKKDERRKMFEEAAGIGRYTKKKIETKSLLEKSEINLSRLSDVIYNFEKDIRKLESQAEKAKIYKEKKDALEQLDVTLMVQDLLKWNDEVKHDSETVKTLSKKVEELRFERNELQEISEEAELKFREADVKLTELTEQREELNSKINYLKQKEILYTSNLNNEISSNDKIVRANAYKKIISDNEVSLKNLNNEIVKVREEAEKAQSDYDSANEARSKFNSEMSEISQNISSKRARFESLQEQIDRMTASQRGVQTIMKNRSALPGIIGTVSSMIEVSDEYEVAISTALGRTVSNIITQNKDNATNAVNFLKRNKTGRATFLPLDIIKPRYIKPDSLEIASKLEGFVNVASKLVKYDEKIKSVIDNLLGQVLIADNIDNATRIADMTFNAYKVISLDGDVNFVGGAIEGGSSKSNKTSMLNIEERMETLKKELEVLNEEKSKLNVNLEKANIEYNIANKKMQASSINLNDMERNISHFETKINENKLEFEGLTGTSYDDITEAFDENELKKEILSLENELRDLSTLISNATEEKVVYQDKNGTSNHQLNEVNVNLDNLSVRLNQKQNNLTQMRNGIENAESRIVGVYNMTVETAIEKFDKPLDIPTDIAKSEVMRLKADIDALGNVNLAAFEELETKQAEYNTIKVEYDNAKEAVDELESTLKELDKKARKDFEDIINKVNDILPSIFRNLFGGGNCRIECTEPADVLTSGIDVIVQPPGKKISNLILLSGGEKTLVALAVLFAILKSSSFPMVVLDEAEAALDQANVDIFAKIIKDYSDNTQFLIITHRPGTMKTCDVLYGATMQRKGITRVLKTDISEIKNKYESASVSAEEE